MTEELADAMSTNDQPVSLEDSNASEDASSIEVGDQELQQTESKASEDDSFVAGPSDDDPYESEAKLQGWAPKDQWRGDPSDWKTAKQFLETGVMIKRIDALQKRLSKQDNMMKTMASTLSKAESDRLDNAIKSLEGQLQVAKQNADLESYDALRSQIDTLRQKSNEFTNNNPYDSGQDEPATITESAEFKQFSALNPWVAGASAKDKAIQAFAAEAVNAYEASNPMSSVDERLSYVHKQVRKEFPHWFSKGPNKGSNVEGTNTVGKNNTSSKSNPDYIVNTLPDEHKQVAMYLKKSGQSDAYKKYVTEVKRQLGK